MRRVLKTFLVLIVLSMGCAFGFTVALFSVWTGVLDASWSSSDFQILRDKDGGFLRIPSHEESLTLSAHSEPYRTSPVVDLFNNQDAAKEAMKAGP